MTSSQSSSQLNSIGTVCTNRIMAYSDDGYDESDGLEDTGITVPDPPNDLDGLSFPHKATLDFNADCQPSWDGGEAFREFYQNW